MNNKLNMWKKWCISLGMLAIASIGANQVLADPLPVIVFGDGPVVVITRPVHTQHLTHQANRIGILILGDKRVLHFVSAAKNTVAFFKMSFSIFRRLISALSLRFSSCSGVSLPFPRNA